MSKWEHSTHSNNDVETDLAKRRYDELTGRVYTEEETAHRRAARESTEQIMREKDLPKCGETRFWVDQERQDKEAADAKHPRFKMISWNIERGYKVEEQIEHLRTVDPDVLCLQEVDWGCGRTGDKNIALHIAEELGFKYIGFTTEFVEIDDDQKFSKNTRHTARIGRGSGVHGQAILSRFPVESIKSIKLNKLFFDWEDKSPATEHEPRTGQRIAQKILIKMGDRHLVIYNAHFENVAGGELGRMTQFDEVVKDAGQEEAPTIIVGDFNTINHGVAKVLPGNRGDIWTKALKGLGKTAAQMWEKTEFSDSPEHVQLEQALPPELRQKKQYASPHVADAATFKIGPVYKGKLDWTVLEKDRFKVIQEAVGPEGMSDHRYLMVEAEMK